MADARLQVIIEAVNRASGEMRKVVEDLGRVRVAQREANREFEEGLRGIRNVGLVMSGFAAAGALAVRSFAQEAIEARQAEAQLDVAVRNAGQSYAEFKARIDDATASLQRKTGIDDEAQRRSLALLTGAVGDVNTALAALPSVLDIAAATGNDLGSTAIQLGRVLSGQQETIRGLTVNFEGAVTAAEKLARVQGTLGGTAEAVASPFSRLGRSVDELKESIGTAMLPIIERFVGGLQGMIDWLTRLPGPVQQAIGTGGVALTGLLGIGGAIALATSQIPKMVAGIQSLIGAFAALRATAAAAWLAALGPAALAAGLLGMTAIGQAGLPGQEELTGQFLRQGKSVQEATFRARQELQRRLQTGEIPVIGQAGPAGQQVISFEQALAGAVDMEKRATEEAARSMGQLSASLERYQNELDLATSFTGDFTDALDRMGLPTRAVQGDVNLMGEELVARLIQVDSLAEGFSITWEQALAAARREMSVTSDSAREFSLDWAQRQKEAAEATRVAQEAIRDEINRTASFLERNPAFGAALIPQFTGEQVLRQFQAAQERGFTGSLAQFQGAFAGLPVGQNAQAQAALEHTVNVFIDGRQVSAAIGDRAENEEQARSS